MTEKEVIEKLADTLKNLKESTLSEIMAQRAGERKTLLVGKYHAYEEVEAKLKYLVYLQGLGNEHS